MLVRPIRRLFGEAILANSELTAINRLQATN